METKPFSIQSPQNIAQDYGGDKQKIAQGIQMGVIDPTAGLLAGMFIDRMRSAAVQEAAPQQTVAQQVFAPPAPPPQMPMQAPPAPAGLGAIPPTPAMPTPEGPPMEMADGGIATLPVPDGMFDEPDNGGYAGGGLLAFARGGSSEDDYAALVERLYPSIEHIESGGRPRPGPMTKYGQAQGIAQMLPDTARGVASKLGIPYNPELLSGKTPEAINYQRTLAKAYLREGAERYGGDPAKIAMFYHGGPNTKIWGPNTQKYRDMVLAHMGRGSGAAASGLGALAAPPRMAESLEPDIREGMGVFDKYMPKPKTEARDRLSAEIEARMSPEQQAKDSREDKWMMLAQLGFGLAASSSPHFLQALGSAAAAALPAARDMKKERRAQRDADIRALAEIEGISNKEAREKVMFGMDYAKDKAGLTKADIAAAAEQQRLQLNRDELTQRGTEGAANRQTQLDIARIGASRPENLDFRERTFATLKAENPNATTEQILETMKRLGVIGGAQQAAGVPGAAANLGLETTAPANGVPKGYKILGVEE